MTFTTLSRTLLINSTCQSFQILYDDMCMCTTVCPDFTFWPWFSDFKSHLCQGYYLKMLNPNLSIFYIMIGQYLDVCTGVCFSWFDLLTFTYCIYSRFMLLIIEFDMVTFIIYLALKNNVCKEICIIYPYPFKFVYICATILFPQL